MKLSARAHKQSQKWPNTNSHRIRIEIGNKQKVSTQNKWRRRRQGRARAPNRRKACRRRRLSGRWRDKRVRRTGEKMRACARESESQRRRARFLSLAAAANSANSRRQPATTRRARARGQRAMAHGEAVAIETHDSQRQSSSSSPLSSGVQAAAALRHRQSAFCALASAHCDGQNVMRQFCGFSSSRLPKIVARHLCAITSCLQPTAAGRDNASVGGERWRRRRTKLFFFSRPAARLEARVARKNAAVDG